MNKSLFEMVDEHWEEIISHVCEENAVSITVVNVVFKRLVLLGAKEDQVHLLGPTPETTEFVRKKYTLMLEIAIEELLQVNCKVVFWPTRASFFENENKLTREKSEKNAEEVKRRWQEILDQACKGYQVSDVSYKTWLKPLVILGVGEYTIHLMPPDSVFLKYLNCKYLMVLEYAARDVLGRNYKIVFWESEEEYRKTVCEMLELHWAKDDGESEPKRMDSQTEEKRETMDTEFFGKIIEELFESEDMKNYLKLCMDKLTKYQWITMVTGAPVSINRKLVMLEALADAEDLTCEIFGCADEEERSLHMRDSYLSAYLKLKKAVQNLTETADGVLLAKYCQYSEDDLHLNDVMVGLDMSRLKAYEECATDDPTWSYIDIEKWVPSQDGQMVEMWNATLYGGQIVYFRDVFAKEDICEPNAMWLNLPVPFKRGDLIEVTVLPFQKKQYALIIDIGDNQDCCSVQVMYVSSDGQLMQGALKHGDLYGSRAYMLASPLYSARRFEGKLPEHERVLSAVKACMEWECFFTGEKLEMTPENVLEVVAKELEVSKEKITGTDRSPGSIKARQMVMYILREHGKMPIREIGALVGGRDHTTIIYGSDKIKELISKDSEIEKSVRNVLKRFLRSI